jgi:hypothetical protein
MTAISNVCEAGMHLASRRKFAEEAWMKNIGLFLVALLMMVAVSTGPASAALLGPSAYASTADSPFSPFAGFTYFFIENFDDHLLNTPGVSVSPGTVKTSANSGFNGSIIDQVGLAGGCPSGGTTVACDTLFGGGVPGFTFTFDAGVLGALPDAVGVAWTDGAGTITFEAFDQSGISLGSLIGNHADGSFSGTIDDDRFYGATNSGGISKITISNSSGGIEVDDLQYGRRGVVSEVPEPASLLLLGSGLVLLAGVVRRRLG